MSLPTSSIPQPQTTGKYLVLLNEEQVDTGIQVLSDRTGIQNFAHARDFADAPPPEQLASNEPLVFDNLGVAVVSLDPEQLQAANIAVASSSALLTIEPERIVYAIQNPRLLPFGEDVPQVPSSDSVSVSIDYLKGYRDGVNQLVDSILQSERAVAEEFSSLASNAEFTWGLQQTKVNTSSHSGLGIKVAVLDTGMDLTHPDFVGRTIVEKSFIEGETVQDGNGHGTHCIGTACGSRLPAVLPRYGVAYNAEIYAGKVLSNEGSGADGGILGGINWAIASGCPIISMSLGARVLPGQKYSDVYEQVAQRALAQGTLIIAAAGNDSFRQFGLVFPVSHPANCPSILAVAAVTDKLRPASFSNGGTQPDGGQIDIAAPGVDIYSSWFMPTRYNTISGTSMATPHVAGIAALYAEATGARGQELWSQLTRNALRLSSRSRDVGNGLAQAIQ
ncbi:S8 family serine peptidase [Leptolyngbya sp. FACHB-36]|uniref:S8 family peptidase n=1 Tax=Leptolyngbya sp. FACHB-36 TaxID=2692808 RepID=UPI00168043E1|nr:S8 family serine peptidase [Leptolyngbya sp. FACHB-36]MBD2020764.1 S8 family serine peptidase [Leptolyngbya sp. FACHB-36]